MADHYLKKQLGDSELELYVSLSEIDDAQFKVSKEYKALNDAFYGGPQ